MVCKTLNYIEYFLILASAITGCISISAFASLFDIPMGNMGSKIELKICAIAVAIEEYKLIIRKIKGNITKQYC